MRFITREMEVALNILEILHVTQERWTMKRMAEHLEENRTFIYKSARVLVRLGLISGDGCPGGGYLAEPGIPNLSLLRLYRGFGYNQVPSLLSESKVSGKALEKVNGMLRGLKFKDLLTEEETVCDTYS